MGVAVIDASARNPLLLEGETARQAVARLEHEPHYQVVIASEEGQALLTAAAAEDQAGRNGSGKKRSAETAVASTPDAPSVPDQTPAAPTGKRVEAPTAMALPVAKIEVADNVRVDLGDLTELVASIREHGILQPIVVTGVYDGDARTKAFRVLEGHRRLAAAIQAGYETVPAIFEHRSSLGEPGAQRAIVQLSENLIRKDLNPIEEADAMRAILDADKKLTHAELAKRLGIGESTVTNTVALLKAPKKVQELVRAGKTTQAHVRAVAGLDTDQQTRLVESAVRNSMSAHSLEESAKWERQRAKEREADGKRLPAAVERGSAALEAAGVARDAKLYVRCEDYRIQDAELRKALIAAGWTGVVDEWAWQSKRWSQCDCTTRILVVRDGTGSTIEPICSSKKHQEALEAEHRAEQKARSERDDQDRKALKAAIAAALKAQPPHPTVVRLLLRALDSYAGDSWTEYAKKSDTAALTELAERISTRHGTAYGQKVPVKTVLKLLAGEEAPARELPSGRKPGKAKAAAS